MSVVIASCPVRRFEVFVGIGVEKQKKFCERVYCGPSELWWGGLRWGGSSEPGGRLTDNLIGEEIAPFLLRIFNATCLQCEIFQSLHT